MLRCVFLALLLCSLLLAGCGGGGDSDKQLNKALVLYSELDPKYTENLVHSYNKSTGGKILLKAIYEIKPDTYRPDLVLAESRTLAGLKAQGKLRSVFFELGDRIPTDFKDGEGFWYGAFYDPTVFLVNQQFARKVGQKNIEGWHDLENLQDVRLAVENLSDSNSTKNFLGAMADHMGEATSLNYMWNINRSIAQYAKFPFTPIRMTAVGDADLAVTRQSYVFKYLENDFPSYVVHPNEGSPINLYGVGVFADCGLTKEAASFFEWLIGSAEVQKISQLDAVGYHFLFPRGKDYAAADTEKLWLNKNYVDYTKQEELVAKWLEKVRFSK